MGEYITDDLNLTPEGSEEEHEHAFEWLMSDPFRRNAWLADQLSERLTCMICDRTAWPETAEEDGWRILVITETNGKEHKFITCSDCK